MSTKCFVRTLKEEINNNNLPRIDTLHISITKAGEYTMHLPGIISLEVVGNGYLIQEGIDKGKIIPEYDGENVTIHADAPLSLLAVGVSNAHGMFNVALDTDTNKYISFDIAEVLQNTEQYNSLRIGRTSRDATMSQGSWCTGDVTDMAFNTYQLYMGGCSHLTGSMNNVIRNYATSDNLIVVNFSGTKLTFDLSYLIGKNNLYILPSNAYTSGDIKYYGDTRNRYIDIATKGSNNLTGTIEDLVDRLIAQGRTGENDIIYLLINSSRFKNVTYQDAPLPSYYTESENTTYMVFTWDSEARISYTLTTTNPNNPYIPIA